MRFSDKISDFLNDFRETEDKLLRAGSIFEEYLNYSNNTETKEEIENTEEEEEVIAEEDNQKIHSDNSLENSTNHVNQREMSVRDYIFLSKDEKSRLGSQIAEKWLQESKEFERMFKDATHYPVRIFESTFGSSVYVAKINGEAGFIFQNEFSEDISRKFVEDRENLRMYFIPFGSLDVKNMNGQSVSEEKKNEIFFKTFITPKIFDDFKNNLKKGEELLDFLNTYYERKLETMKKKPEDSFKDYEDLSPKIKEYVNSKLMNNYKHIVDEYNADNYSTQSAGYILYEEQLKNIELSRNEHYGQYYLTGFLGMHRKALLDFLKKTDNHAFLEELNKREQFIESIWNDKVKIDVNNIPEKIEIDRANPYNSLFDLERYANDVVNKLNKESGLNLKVKVIFDNEGLNIGGFYRYDLYNENQRKLFPFKNESITIKVNPQMGHVDRDTFLFVLGHEYGHALHKKEVAFATISHLANLEEYICERKNNRQICDRSSLSLEEREYKYFNEMLKLSYYILGESKADMIGLKLAGLEGYEKRMKTKCKSETTCENLSNLKMEEVAKLPSYSFGGRSGRETDTTIALIKFMEQSTSKSFNALQDVAKTYGIQINDSVYTQNMENIGVNSLSEREKQTSYYSAKTKVKH